MHERVMGPELVRLSDGSLQIKQLAPWFVGVLFELPALLDSDQPEEVSRRLYPEPSDDEEIRETWDKYVRPELFALVASAREIVSKDIEELGPTEDEEAGPAFWELAIPEKHIQAWISALNIARLSLATKYGVEGADIEELIDLNEDESEEAAERRYAITRVHLLGWLQQLLIEQESPPPEDFDLLDGLEGF
ncbi:MAG: DUF2017 family protein [Planctomycetota bacterium]